MAACACHAGSGAAHAPERGRDGRSPGAHATSWTRARSIARALLWGGGRRRVGAETSLTVARFGGGGAWVGGKSLLVVNVRVGEVHTWGHGGGCVLCASAWPSHGHPLSPLPPFLHGPPHVGLTLNTKAQAPQPCRPQSHAATPLPASSTGRHDPHGLKLSKPCQKPQTLKPCKPPKHTCGLNAPPPSHGPTWPREGPQGVPAGAGQRQRFAPSRVTGMCMCYTAEDSVCVGYKIARQAQALGVPHARACMCQAGRITTCYPLQARGDRHAIICCDVMMPCAPVCCRFACMPMPAVHTRPHLECYMHGCRRCGSGRRSGVRCHGRAAHEPGSGPGAEGSRGVTRGGARCASHVREGRGPAGWRWRDGVGPLLRGVALV